jgi:hypothetical protein
MYSRLYRVIYSQTGRHSNNKLAARMPPVIKLLQARKASMKRMEALQRISNVFMRLMYNIPALASMGIIP